MNWYDHHIRGYDADTQHLSWDQDMAYTRLLRFYYRKEVPIPSDLDEACRQIRAADHREDVQKVLDEFFVLRADGWHRGDVDTAIAKYQAGEPEREAKRINEDARQLRHRTERAHLFGVINAAGQHRAWNTPIAQLRTLAEALTEERPEDETSNASHGPATPPATAPATPPRTETATPATATNTNTNSIPNSNPNSNSNPSSITNSMVYEEGTHIGAGKEKEAVPGQPDSRALFTSAICLALKAEGIEACDPGHPKLAELIDAGAQVQNFISAAATAKGKAHPFHYVLGTVEGQLADARVIAGRGKATINGHGGKTERAARMAKFTGAPPETPTDPEARDVAT